MAKFSNTKNVLKDLVLTGSDKEYGRQTIKGIIRSLLEPLLEQPSQEGLVLMRLSGTDGIASIIKRLEFSDVKMYSYCDNLTSGKIVNIEKKHIWEDTEFILILAPRYSTVLIWDWTISNNDMSQICLILNSREISDIANTMFENATVDLVSYLTTYAPDRREQKTMNNAINKVVNCLDNVNQEMVFTQAEKENYSETETLMNEYKQISEKAKFTAHEIKNNVSVIDLYTKVLEKRLENVQFDEEAAKSVKNAINSIKQSAFAVSNLISEIRTFSRPILTDKQLSSIVADVVKLVAPKAKEKNISIESFVGDEYRVHTDEAKLQSVILNILYNAIDATDKNGRITLKIGEKENNKIPLLIQDSGNGIPEDIVLKIFDEGFTTKIDGNGLGLCICKKLMQEQYGDVKLIRTGSDGTEFAVLIPLI